MESGPLAISGCVVQPHRMHFGGGNLVYVDGHAKYRPFRLLRSSDFGLAPDESYVADTTQGTCAASGSCTGKAQIANP